jgi:hypothetical protein
LECKKTEGAFGKTKASTRTPQRWIDVPKLSYGKEASSLAQLSSALGGKLVEVCCIACDLIDELFRALAERLSKKGSKNAPLLFLATTPQAAERGKGKVSRLWSYFSLSNQPVPSSEVNENSGWVPLSVLNSTLGPHGFSATT